MLKAFSSRRRFTNTAVASAGGTAFAIIPRHTRQQDQANDQDVATGLVTAVGMVTMMLVAPGHASFGMAAVSRQRPQQANG